MNDINKLNQNFNGIQVLRFFAAFLVLLTHSTFYVSTRLGGAIPLWNDGAQGVSIFFVISGFVMMLSSRSFINMNGGYMKFMMLRIIRIVPLYWAVSLVKLFIWIVIPATVFANPDYLNIISSFLFIPSFNASNQIEPFYGVGWTLNFEMFFYVIFALAIGIRFRIMWFVGSILVLISILSIFETPQWLAFGFYFNPIVLNFLYGIIIAELLRLQIYISKSIAFGMLSLGLLILFFPPNFSLLGIQYAFLVAGVVFLEPHIKSKIPKVLLFGGNASYALYLIHPMVGPAVPTLLLKLGIGSPWIALVFIILGSLFAGGIVYVFFERPIGKYLKRRFDGQQKRHEARVVLS